MTLRILLRAHLLTLLGGASLVAASGVVDTPVSVAPGELDALVETATRCPSFHWALVEGAFGYEIAVHSLDEDEPDRGEWLRRSFPAGATSWSPAARQCPGPGGRYRWYVRANLAADAREPFWTPWSDARYFAIPARDSTTDRLAGSIAPSADRIDPETRVDSVDRSVSEHEVTPAIALPESGLGGASAALLGLTTDTLVTAFGVIGDSLGGGGVLAAGSFAGADLVLDGSRSASVDTQLREDGIYRNSPSLESFDFDNLGNGSLLVRINGSEIVTAATEQDTLADLTCPVGEFAESGGGGDWACSGAGAWRLGGNAGTNPATQFLGTTDAQPLTLRVGNVPALRLQYGDAGASGSGPNVVGGFVTNSIAVNVIGATIAGGGSTAVGNSVTASQGAIGGGLANSVSASAGTIAGGSSNSVAGVSGAIPGGSSNVVNGTDSFAAGRQARALHDNSFVWNDGGGNFSSTAAGQFLIDVADGVGIGVDNPSDMVHINAPAGRDALRVQVDGTTRLRVLANGGVAIGNNEPAPAAGLHVYGEITTEPKPRTLSITAYSLPCNTSVCGYQAGGHSLVCNELGDCQHYAAVNLPHGAVITGLSMKATDISAVGHVLIELNRVLLADLGTGTMASVDTNSVPQGSGIVVTDASIAGAVIDTDNYAYWLHATFSTANNIALHWVQIQYTLTRVLP